MRQSLGENDGISSLRRYGCQRRVLVRVVAPRFREVALVRPGNHGKATIFPNTVEHGKHDLRQARDHLSVATVILTLGYDRRAVHVQPREPASPAVDGVGMIQSIGSAGDRLHRIEHGRAGHFGCDRHVRRNW